MGTKGQQQDLQQTNQVTYMLRAGDGHKGVSRHLVVNQFNNIPSEGHQAIVSENSTDVRTCYPQTMMHIQLHVWTSVWADLHPK